MSIRQTGLLPCSGLLLLAFMSGAFGGEPIPGVDIYLADCNVCKPPYKGGGIVATNGNGSVTFQNLTPGDYELRVDGKSLVAAMERLNPSKTAGDRPGPSFSLGLGGMLAADRALPPTPNVVQDQW